MAGNVLKLGKQKKSGEDVSSCVNKEGAIYEDLDSLMGRNMNTTHA